ncbi:hypothetical protein RU639_000177 [Aspergillus parasiticus]
MKHVSLKSGGFRDIESWMMLNAQSMLTTPGFLYIHRITFNNGGHGIPMVISWKKYRLFPEALHSISSLNLNSAVRLYCICDRLYHLSGFETGPTIRR